MIMQKSSIATTVEFLGTPEAGKTTMVHMLAEKLSKSRKPLIVREAAETLPVVFPKNSVASNFWIGLKTAQTVLEAQYQKDYDIILADRGIIDRYFWNYYYASIGEITWEQADSIHNCFDSIGISKPNLVVALSITPEEAIRRRGGEGHIVTLEFIEDFNQKLYSFIKTIAYPVIYLDTTQMSKEEVFEFLIQEISKL